MKQLIILSSFLYSFIGSAQIISVELNLETTPEGIQIKGKELIFADDVRTIKEHDFYTFSKGEEGEIDTLYFQRFETDKNLEWQPKEWHSITHQGIIKISKIRKRYMDYDGDKSVEALYTFSKNDHNQNQQTANFLLVSKGEFITVESKRKKDCEFDEPQVSDNFKTLPKDAQKNILEFWSSVDKCFND